MHTSTIQQMGSTKIQSVVEHTANIQQKLVHKVLSRPVETHVLRLEASLVIGATAAASGGRSGGGGRRVIGRLLRGTGREMMALI